MSNSVFSDGVKFIHSGSDAFFFAEFTLNKSSLAIPVSKVFYTL
ncbi:16699_t:CDS:2 [Dentiscutata erythropus]|uniref:16699_t:CDS:1 n=1 Tax=Dentiscutata erythropus TaxID=1348616 RepID=A0A9N9HPW8_9GLOM|nr:16699_t:CDS:2 [Dentiscutata erythropus]